MIERSKRSAITKIVGVAYKNGQKTERELTPEEVEEWKKEHVTIQRREKQDDLPSTDSN